MQPAQLCRLLDRLDALDGDLQAQVVRQSDGLGARLLGLPILGQIGETGAVDAATFAGQFVV